MNLEVDDNKRWTVMAYPVVFFLRRVLLVITVILMRNFLWGQLAIQFTISVFLVIYLQWY